MRYGVLGTFEVWDGERRIPLADKWRALLATLLVNANRTVSVDRLLYELYGEQPPGSAAKLIQVYVSKLRRALDDATGTVLTTRPTGYCLLLTPEEMDAGRFERLATEGRQALHADSPESAVDLLGTALALWRGPAFADVAHSAAVQAAAVRLEELRLTAWEAWADAQLALGRYAEMIGELRTAVFEHPLRERLRAQLMLALAGAGRRADALAEYVAGRQVLIDELGVEPGAPMQAVHTAILSGIPLKGAGGTPRPHNGERPKGTVAAGPFPIGSAPAGTFAGHSPTGGAHAGPFAGHSPGGGGTVGAFAGHSPNGYGPAGRAPCQLPRSMPDFVGRAAEKRQTRELLVGNGKSPHGPRVVVITGQPGVGKSTLAVHVAHCLWPDFRDGQLYADLRTADNRPADPGELLAGLLGSLGYPASLLPRETSQRAALWRDALANRKVLVLLDNAADERQVRAMIPGTPGSAVLVTSRSRLTGLEAAQRLQLPELAVEAAVELLSRIIGDDRVRAEQAAAAELILLCGRVPLAVRIAGARLASHPEWTVERYAAMLRPAEQRLDHLVAGDLSMREAIGLSEAGLDATAARAFYHLALHNLVDLPDWACGPLVDIDEGQSQMVTDHLVERNLLVPHSTHACQPVRYRLHELIALYGRERGEQVCPEDHRDALRRLCANYLAMTRLIERRLSVGFGWPACDPVPPPHLSAQTVNALLTNPYAWLEAERGTLLGLIERATEAGLAAEAGALAASLGPSLEVPLPKPSVFISEWG
ncbi:MAG TPA: BTAD domain-containing putative transcriptional regulator [Candidatus Limnocylindrales bacterium]